MTGIVTASWIPLIIAGSDMRATPPSRRMSAGTRSSAITAQAPACSAIRACSGVTTSMITPPLSISARPVLTLQVALSAIGPDITWTGSAPPVGGEDEGPSPAACEDEEPSSATGPAGRALPSTSVCTRGCGLCAPLRPARRGRGQAPGRAPSAPCWSGRRKGCWRSSRGSARRARRPPTVDASEIARVRARRCSASFIARSSSGWARPEERTMTRVSSSIRPSRCSDSPPVLATISARMSSRLSSVAQVAGEEGHLVDADDHDALRFGERRDGAVDLLAGEVARGFLEVRVVGAERALQLGVVEGEERRAACRRRCRLRWRCGTPRSRPAAARDSPRSRGPGRSAPPSMTRCSLSGPAPRR